MQTKSKWKINREKRHRCMIQVSYTTEQSSMAPCERPDDDHTYSQQVMRLS